MSGAASLPSSAVRGLALRMGERVFALDRPRLTVGRSRSCDVRLQEDTVSRLHAAFSWQDAALQVEDLGSSNGTYVNGQKVSSARPLAAGDVVRFGALRGTIEDPASPAVIRPTDSVSDLGYDYTVGILPGRPAGLGRRLAAALLDLILFAAGSAVPFAPLLVAMGVERFLLAPEAIPPSLETKLVIAGGCLLLWLVFGWYYFVHGWARRGGTPGLRLTGLRLADWQQRVPIGHARAWLRLAALLVTGLTLGLGFLVVPFRRDRKALHDILAGTLVVRR